MKFTMEQLDGGFLPTYKLLYPAFPNENPQLPELEREDFRLGMMQDFYQAQSDWIKDNSPA